MSDVLLNQFKGAIAGATLGYFIGKYYQARQLIHHQDHGQSNVQKRSCPVLDLSWLHKVIQDSDEQLNSPPHTFLSNLLRGFNPFHIRDTLSSNSHLTVSDYSFIAMFGELDCSDQYSRIVHHPLTPPTYIAHSALQAAFILLPKLLFFHDDNAKQQEMVEHTLVNWLGSNQWKNDIVGVGELLASAAFATASSTMPSPMLATSNLVALTSLSSPVSPIALICKLFCRAPNSYETGIMALVNYNIHFINSGCNHSPKDEPHGDDLALMAGLMGALLGCYGGFSGLPLYWRYLLCSDIPRVLSWAHFQQKLLHWSTQLTASWCGVHRLAQEEGSSPTVPTVGVLRTLT